MTIEIVEFTIKNGGSFHSYVSLPKGSKKRCFFLVSLKRMVCLVCLVCLVAKD